MLSRITIQSISISHDKRPAVKSIIKFNAFQILHNDIVPSHSLPLSFSSFFPHSALLKPDTIESESFTSMRSKNMQLFAKSLMGLTNTGNPTKTTVTFLSYTQINLSNRKHPTLSFHCLWLNVLSRSLAAHCRFVNTSLCIIYYTLHLNIQLDSYICLCPLKAVCYASILFTVCVCHQMVEMNCTLFIVHQQSQLYDSWVRQIGW